MTTSTTTNRPVFRKPFVSGEETDISLPEQGNEDSTRPALWTVAEFQRFAALGAFDDDKRYELIDGVIYEKMPPDPPHAGGTSLIAHLIERAFAGTECFAREEKPMVIAPKGQPQPDVAIVRGKRRDYLQRHPTPEDVLLLVETTDSTQQHDRVTKKEQYARAGIIEYWIVNLRTRCVEVHRQSKPDEGKWAVEFKALETERVAPLLAPDSQIAVSDLLP